MHSALINLFALNSSSSWSDGSAPTMYICMHVGSTEMTYRDEWKLWVESFLQFCSIYYTIVHVLWSILNIRKALKQR